MQALKSILTPFNLSLLSGLAALAACGVETGPAPDEATSHAALSEAGGIPEAAGPDLFVELAAPQAKIAADRRAEVSVTITNVSGHPVRVLRRTTPLDGIRGPVFDVRRDGAPVAYVGRLYKWAPPTREDYVVLQSGEQLSRTVDLATAYDLSAAGSYAIAYGDPAIAASNKSAAVAMNIAARPFTVPSEAEFAPLGARPGALAAADASVVVTQSLTTTGCTSARISQVQSAFIDARAEVGDSLYYLVTHSPSNTPRYRTWFGNATSGNWSTIEDHYTAISNALADHQSVDCTCTDSSYAFVYAGSPYTIHLCNAFWPAPLEGTDSKAGTLIHEMSHFNVTAGTRDYAYGQTACKNLANTNVSQALANADSHEYFAENTPQQQ